MYTCQIFRDDKEIFHSYENGIMPMYNLLKKDKDFFVDAHVVDKVIGKAAGVLLVYGKAKSCHGKLMSVQAVEYLQEKNIPFTYDVLVERIYNRTQTDFCPMEKSVLHIDDEKLGFEILDEFIINRESKRAKS